MEEKELDYVLVPLGLAVFGSYHIWLLFSIIRYPRRTVVGLNAESRHQWVFSMMTDTLSQQPNLNHNLQICYLFGFSVVLHEDLEDQGCS
ncbi:hypothetical protein CsSME_00054072 [Camellia sinensis var. sinensis]